MRKGMLLGLMGLTMLFFQVAMASANKSEASIEGPAEAAKGTEVTLRITATHNANTASHYTEWLKVTANNKEIGRWDFTKENRPEGAVFTREIKMPRRTGMVLFVSAGLHGILATLDG